MLAVMAALIVLLAVAAPASAKRGNLTQRDGTSGCVIDKSAGGSGCATARALDGPGPFMGSRAIAVSPDGRNVYVAASESDAIAIFKRNANSGKLKQSGGAAGCVARDGTQGCTAAIGLDGPNSVAISDDGRNVYATSRESSAVTAFARNPQTGALTQLPGAAGCISGLAIPTCASGEALAGPDVLVVSPDGANVYVGSFFANAVVSFARDPATGALTQLSGGAACIGEANAACSTGIALGAPEGLAISADGASVFVASALSNAVVALARDPSSGALGQATDGTGCIVQEPLAGCTDGVQLSGANAVALSPGGEGAYVTSLSSNSVTSFDSTPGVVGLTQKQGTRGCLVLLRAVGCSFGRALSAPEGIVVSPDGHNAYVAAFGTGAIDVLARNSAGRLTQKGAAGCLATSVAGCAQARAMRGTSSLAVSPDGRNVYSTAFESDAVGIFRRDR